MARARHLISLAVVALGVIALVATLPSGAGAAPESQSFDTPGSHSFVVPDGVTQITVDAHGAAGGGINYPGNPVQGGLGGRTVATIAVTPGETLQVNVGGEGDTYDDDAAATGGVNGGGDAGSFGAGGGGGASDVRRGGTGLEDRVVVAGGGGGGGGDDSCEQATGGAGGGGAPSAGESSDGATGGQPGASAAGGAGGTPSGEGGAGDAGAAGAGGDGGAPSDGGYGGAGGGAGWFGGGGGGAGFNWGAAGGGGSAHIAEDATDVTYENGSRAGDGVVVLTWTANAPTTTTTTTSTTTTTTTEVPGSGPVASYGDDAAGGRSSLTVVPGGDLTIASQGWQPSSVVTVTMFSDPVELGTVRAGADGRFVASFAVPAGTELGSHRVVLTGVGADGEPAEVVLSLEVTAASAGSASPTAPKSLAFTC
jgi:hypothetical protein